MGGLAPGQTTLRHQAASATTTRPAAPPIEYRAPPVCHHSNNTAAPRAPTPLTGFAARLPVVAEKITKRQPNGPLLRRTCLTVAAPPRKAPTPSGEVRLGSIR